MMLISPLRTFQRRGRERRASARRPCLLQVAAGKPSLRTLKTLAPFPTQFSETKARPPMSLAYAAMMTRRGKRSVSAEREIHMSNNLFNRSSFNVRFDHAGHCNGDVRFFPDGDRWILTWSISRYYKYGLPSRSRSLKLSPAGRFESCCRERIRLLAQPLRLNLRSSPPEFSLSVVRASLTAWRVSHFLQKQNRTCREPFSRAE